MSTDCTLADREKFEAWLRQSPENALAFEDTKALWTSLDSLYGDEAIGPHVAAALVPDADHFMGQWSRAIEGLRSEEHTSELQSLMRSSYAVFCLKNKK